MNNLLCRVLLIDDNQNDYLIVRDLFAAIATTRYDLEWVDSYEAAYKTLAYQQYDVCLLDYGLGGTNGMKLVREFADSETPFILLAGNEDHEVDVEATEAGAADYLLKGHINAALLERSIRYAIERKKTEAALLQAQRFAQATVDALPGHIAVLDSLGMIIAVNATWRDFAASSGFIGSGSGIGANYLEVCDRSDEGNGRAIATCIRAVMAGEETVSGLEYRCDSPTAQRWFRVSATRFSGDGPLHIVLAHEDITGRKLAEQQVKVHSQLLSVIGQAIVVTDPTGTINYWNAFAEKLYGWSSGEVLGRNIVEVTPSQTTQAQAAEILVCLSSGESWSGEFIVQKRDGTKFPAYVTDTPVLNESGDVVSIIGLSFDITDRKQAEAERVAKSREIVTIWESMTDAFFSLDLQWRFIHVNSQAARMLHKNRSELIGKTIWDEFPAAIGSLSHQEYEKAMQQQLRVDFEEFYSPLNAWFEVHAHPSDVGLSVYFRDITERKQSELALRTAEQEARESKERLRFALESADIGDWTLDLRSNVAQRSLRHDQCFGYIEPLAEWGYDTFLEHIQPFDRDRVNASFQGAMVGNGEYDEELRVTWPDNSEHWLWTKGRFSFDEMGKAYRVAGIVADITERKQVESSLRESEERFRAVFDQAAVGICVVGMDYCFQRVNECFCEIVGYSADELIGDGTCVDTTHPDDRTGDAAGVARLLSGEESVTLEKRYIRKDERVVWARLTLSLMRSSLGEPQQFLGVIADITERKLAEDLLVESQQRLALATASAKIGIWDWDVVANKLVWDAQMYALYGIREQDFSGAYEAWQNGLHPEDRDGGDADITAALKGSREFHRQFRVVWPGGEVRHIEAHGLVQRREDGSAVRMTGLNRDITERIEASEALGRLAAIVEFSTDAIIGKSLDGVITSWNAGAKSLYGYSSEEAIGLHTSALIARRRPDEETELLQRIAQGETVANFETVRTCKDGRQVDVSLTLSPVKNEKGQVVGASAIARDISDRKQVEHALRESEENFRLLSMRLAKVLDSSLDAICTFDAGGCFVQVSAACEKIWGYRPEELIGTPYIEKVLPEDRPLTLQAAADVVAGQPTTHFENRYVRKDGAVTHIVWSAWWSESEGIMFCVARDNTQAHRAREALRESEERFSAAFEYAPIGVALVSTKGQWLKVNRAVCDLVGYSEAELLALTFQDITHAEDLNLDLENVRRMLAGELTSYVMEKRYIHHRGHMITALLSVSLVRDEGSLPLYFVSHIQDISERKRAEAALLKANDELELHVMERTAELGTANEALRIENIERQIAMDTLRATAHSLEKAKEEADAANHAKSEFLSRMSHELRTPMNAILGYGQILGMRGHVPDIQEEVEAILKAGRHLLELINEVLDIARIEAGHLSLSLEPVPVRSTTRIALDLVRPLTTIRGIQLVNEEPDEVDSASHAEHYVFADQQRIKQVLVNLLSNAIKYNRDLGQVIVSTSIIPGEAVKYGEHGEIECSGKMRFAVRDTGPGIASQDVPRIFLPFERLGAERTNVEGTGIGLSLCKRLVEAMNGSIGVESVPGVGSTFWVELPLVSAALGMRPIMEESMALQSASPNQDVQEGSLTILYIEDNTSNFAVVEHAFALQNRPISLLAAEQGSVGLDLARSHQPNLILLDLHLPDIMGDVVLQRLQAEPSTRAIPVIVLSADATPRQIERLLAAGATAYLTKPLDLNQFFSVVGQTLDGKEA